MTGKAVHTGLVWFAKTCSGAKSLISASLQLNYQLLFCPQKPTRFSCQISHWSFGHTCMSIVPTSPNSRLFQNRSSSCQFIKSNSSYQPSRSIKNGVAAHVVPSAHAKSLPSNWHCCLHNSGYSYMIHVSLPHKGPTCIPRSFAKVTGKEVLTLLLLPAHAKLPSHTQN